MTTQDLKSLRLTPFDFQNLRRWLAIVKTEEPSQGEWIHNKDEFACMVKLQSKITKALETPNRRK